MEPEQLRVGVVGCGQIAQIMHLPYLTALPHFAVTAVCDLSPRVVQAVADRYGVPFRTTDYRGLIARDDVDAVAVLTMEHTAVAVAAADAGKHLFIEKPIAFSLPEADWIIDAVNRAGVTAMVGYMKRYDPGYEFGAARMRAMKDVSLIRVHDFAGDFVHLTSIFPTVVADDLAPELFAQQQAAMAETQQEALGPRHAHLAGLYAMLLMLSSHDLTVLRGAFGAPERVLYSDAVSPNQLLSVLDYGEGRRCIFEAGVGARYHWWDEQMVAYGSEEIIEITFPNPYIPHAPTVVTIRGNEGDAPFVQTIPVSNDEAFCREWVHFAECIRRGETPRTSLAEARADVELAIAMIQAILVAG